MERGWAACRDVTAFQRMKSERVTQINGQVKQDTIEVVLAFQLLIKLNLGGPRKEVS